MPAPLCLTIFNVLLYPAPIAVEVVPIAVFMLPDQAYRLSVQALAPVIGAASRYLQVEESDWPQANVPPLGAT